MKLLLAVLLLAGLSVAQTTPKMSHVKINKIPADAKDVSTIEGMIHAYYDIVSIFLLSWRVAGDKGIPTDLDLVYG